MSGLTPWAFAVGLGAGAACGEATPPETEQRVVDFGDAGAGGTVSPDADERPDALRPGPARTDARAGGEMGQGGEGGSPDPEPDPDAGTGGAGGGPEPEPDPGLIPDPPAEICRRMRVVDTGADGLNVRPDASTNGAPLTVWFDGTEAEVLAEVMGQSIEGNPVWYEVQREGVHGFVSTVFTECTGRGVAPTPPPPPGPRDDVFLLPFACGEQRRVTQGNQSDRSHNGAAAWAFDFDLPSGAPMRAMKPGQVVFVKGDTVPGDACYEGGGQACADAANYVVLGHADGSRTVYLHLSRVSVAAGQLLAQGDVVGAVGSTGWTSGAHAHVARTEACGAAACNSVPLGFADVPGDGVPVEGAVVTSENGCPP
jgi:hypothetical protein